MTAHHRPCQREVLRASDEVQVGILGEVEITVDTAACPDKSILAVEFAHDDHLLNLRRSFIDLVDFGVPHQLFDRDLTVYPLPPKTCTASVAFFMAASAQYAFAIAADIVLRFPLSTSQAAL